MKTWLLTAVGFLCLGLGTIGILLPVWPTTPFVLVSAACFSATPRLRAKIMNIKFFREHVENYERRTGLSKKTVAISLAYLWTMLSLSILLARTVRIALLLLVIGTAVTLHIMVMAKAKGNSR
ncbi:MAG: YbaN family protein [Sphaerochaetaceae bacterium]|nr:YbaN family protein [Sphaerochaetaceae bacterium]